MLGRDNVIQLVKVSVSAVDSSSRQLGHEVVAVTTTRRVTLARALDQRRHMALNERELHEFGSIPTEMRLGCHCRTLEMSNLTMASTDGVADSEVWIGRMLLQ